MKREKDILILYILCRNGRNEKDHTKKEKDRKKRKEKSLKDCSVK